MSVYTCHHDEEGDRCTNNAVVVDEDGCEWCAKHIPNGAKLVNDFRDEGEVKEIGE